MTIGTISTLTLAGTSVLEATSVSSLIAICMFFVAPRVSKQIDERGQSAIVPVAAVVSMLGFALLLLTVHLGLPFWLCYIAAPFVSFLPNAQSLVRTRWAFLIETGRLGNAAPSIKTAYAYEGILEDIAFMVGPAAVIAVAAATVPAAGMAVGAVVYCIGVVLLLSSKDTEPKPGWSAVAASQSATGDEADGGESDAAASATRNASIIRTSPLVRVFFIVMVLVGAMYGSFDASAVTYCQSIDQAIFASIVLVVQSVFSAVASYAFGMVSLAASLRKQFIGFAVLFGCAYGLFFFVNSPMSLMVISCAAAITYPLLYITLNMTCEHAVPGKNLTEALSWIVSGMSIGMVLGPITSGAVIDLWGPVAGFGIVGVYALLIVVVTVCCIPVLRKRLA